MKPVIRVSLEVDGRVIYRKLNKYGEWEVLNHFNALQIITREQAEVEVFCYDPMNQYESTYFGSINRMVKYESL